MIPSSPRQPGFRVYDRAEADIEALIRERGLRPGQRLPSERALATLLKASRTSLRMAIARLTARGRLVVQQSGITVAEPPSSHWAEAAIVAPLAPLVAEDPGYGQDVLEIRYALESAAAYHAAKRANAADKANIRAHFAAMVARHQTGDALEEARGDAAFHLAIAEASHNAVLRQVMSGLFGLLQGSISRSLEKLYTVPETFERLSEQHTALMDAILAGDAEAARAASDHHLRFVETTICDIDAERARQIRARIARAADASDLD